MLYFSDLDGSGAVIPFDTGLFEGQRRGMVYAPNSLPNDSIYVRTPSGKPWYKAHVSIALCTYGRPESLNETLKSLSQQVYKQFEVVLITEKGNLSELRQKGLESSAGRIVSFIDDDVYCPPTWLQSVVENFREGVVGVTGPSIITKENQDNRDCLRYKRIRRFQEWFFEVPTTPGTLSSCGAPSMESNFEGCDYNGPVEYLECCNMSVIRKVALDVGGFDSDYIRTSEWCEVDLAKRMASKGKLKFSTACGLEHRPSKQGIYNARLSTAHRLYNFKKFQERWIKPSWKRFAYWLFVWTYFKVKQLGWV